MTVAHKNLTETELHENKGASTATDDFVATVTSGATVWKKLTSSNLTTTGNPFGSQLLHVRHVETTGTSAGAVLTNSTWNTRTLNSTVTNEITSATLTSNQISLPAGTYFIDAQIGLAAKIVVSNSAQTIVDRPRLYNVTGSATLVSGVNHSSYHTSNTSSEFTLTPPRSLRGRFTLAGTTTIALQHYVSGSAISLQGSPVTSGESEIYSDVLIWKVA